MNGFRDERRRRVGRLDRTALRVDDPNLDPWLANHLAVTLDREPDLADGDELPPAWHWIFFHDLVRTSQLGAEGHPEVGIVMPPVRLPRRMWAGGTLEFEAPLVLGSTVERVSTIRDIVAKQGRSGPLVFVTIEHEIRTGRRPKLLEEQTIVYRDATDESDRPPTDSADRTPDGADFSAEHILDAGLSFATRP